MTIDMLFLYIDICIFIYYIYVCMHTPPLLYYFFLCCRIHSNCTHLTTIRYCWCCYCFCCFVLFRFVVFISTEILFLHTVVHPYLLYGEEKNGLLKEKAKLQRALVSIFTCSTLNQHQYIVLSRGSFRC